MNAKRSDGPLRAGPSLTPLLLKPRESSTPQPRIYRPVCYGADPYSWRRPRPARVSCILKLPLRSNVPPLQRIAILVHTVNIAN